MFKFLKDKIKSAVKKFITDVDKTAEEVTEEAEESEAQPEKKGFFTKLTETITKKVLSEEKFDELFWDLEVALLENNVAVEVIEKIKQDLKTKLVNQKIDRGKLEENIVTTLQESIESLFIQPEPLLKIIKKEKPYKILFVGINGSGKTTTIAKIAHFF